MRLPGRDCRKMEIAGTPEGPLGEAPSATAATGAGSPVAIPLRAKGRVRGDPPTFVSLENPGARTRASATSPRPAGRDHPANLMQLLEREPHTGELDAACAEAEAGSGCVVVMSGEAGVGKTVLLDRFAERHRDSRSVWWGACEALFTPRPLGPLYDIAYQERGSLLSHLEQASPRGMLFGAFLDAERGGAALHARGRKQRRGRRHVDSFVRDGRQEADLLHLRCAVAGGRAPCGPPQ